MSKKVELMHGITVVAEDRFMQRCLHEIVTY